MFSLLTQVAMAGSITLHVEREIDASPDAVWDVLGAQYADIDDWAAVVEHSAPVAHADVPEGYTAAASAPVGARACSTGIGDFQEVLVDYSDAERTFTFQAAGLPRMMKSSQNTTRVTATEGGSLVVMDIEVEVGGMANLMKGKMEKRMSNMLNGLLADLEAYVETGEPSEAKKLAQTAS